jgi:hypothetical protein
MHSIAVHIAPDLGKRLFLLLFEFEHRNHLEVAALDPRFCDRIIHHVCVNRTFWKPFGAVMDAAIAKTFM